MVQKGALPIHFFRHFCSTMYHLATKHSDQKSCQVSKADFSLKLLIRKYYSIQQSESAALPYDVRSTIGSQQQLSFL